MLIDLPWTNISLDTTCWTEGMLAQDSSTLVVKQIADWHDGRLQETHNTVHRECCVVNWETGSEYQKELLYLHSCP